MISQLLEKINQAEVVSFDMFDTLIYRIYDKPTDLFVHMEQVYKCPGFSDKRMDAERKVREEYKKAGVNEVTLKEIYRKLPMEYRELAEKEMNFELKCCRVNTEMKKAFEYAIENKKLIVIASDMYLPMDIIEKILEKTGYVDYDKIFLSSETRRPKATGEMYEDIIEYVHQKKESVIHIGDHPFTDKEMPEKKGISSFLYLPSKERGGNIHMSSYFSILRKYDEYSIMASITRGIIGANADELKEKSYWYQFGYKYAGIISYSYMTWLYEQVLENKINQVFFMLRDGYIFKRVFDYLYPDIQTQELFGSRRMFMFTGAESIKDVDFHLINPSQNRLSNITKKIFGNRKNEDLNLLNGLTYKNLYERLEIENERLKNDYQERFPNQEDYLKTLEDIDNVQNFFENHETDILECGKEERKCLMHYLKSVGLFEGKCGIVDLGWKATMLKGIEKSCTLEKKQGNIIGFYLGTNQHIESKFQEVSYITHQGVAATQPEMSLLDIYAVNILELMFSAPHPSIMKIKEEGEMYYPVYQDVDFEEQKRIEASREILEGVMDFVKDIHEFLKDFPTKASSKVAGAPMEYFVTSVSKYDEMQIMKMCFFPGVGSDKTSFPINRHCFMHMGIVNPWPGDKSAESEIVMRMQQAAWNIGLGYTILDNFGHVLDQETQKRTLDIVNSDELDFVITTHYDSHKSVDSFYYHALWNPPEIPLNLEDYTERVTNNYISNDDYLIYDSGGMSNHLRTILMNKPRSIEDASLLTGSFPTSVMYEPNLKNPRMFYCGMNWEKVVHNSNRHEGLFKLLDRTGKVKFFGPDVVDTWGGLRPWEGYECYQYSIPFDGFSILKEINECGICLVISSDIHRRAGAVTNRAYEACAAGAVIISDDNEYMQKYFSDAALFINYNKSNPRDTYNQIMEKYQWIVEHPQDAKDLAKKAQEVFKKYFGLENQLMNIIKRHPYRFETIAKDLFAKNDSQTVLVTYVLNAQDINRARINLDIILHNIKRQYYREIILAIAADVSCADEIENYIRDKVACVKVIPMELFDIKGVRTLTDGQAIRRLQKMVPHTYFMNTNAAEIWYYDHVSTLVRAMEDEDGDCEGAYAGRTLIHADRWLRPERFDVYSKGELGSISDINAFDIPGHFIFKASSHSLVPDFIFDNLDGLEQYAYADLLAIRYEKKLSFSKRVTIVKDSGVNDRRYTVVPCEMQIRLIQDIIRFEMKNASTGGNIVTGSNAINYNVDVVGSAKDVLADIPVKLWLKMRYHKIRARIVGFGTNKGQKYMRKYDDEYYKFRTKNWR